jgi:hypothetical protein
LSFIGLELEVLSSSGVRSRWLKVGGTSEALDSLIHHWVEEPIEQLLVGLRETLTQRWSEKLTGRLCEEVNTRLSERSSTRLLVETLTVRLVKRLTASLVETLVVRLLRVLSATKQLGETAKERVYIVHACLHCGASHHFLHDGVVWALRI